MTHLAYAASLRQQAAEAEAELVFRFGYAAAQSRLANPIAYPQQGRDDLAHYLAVVFFNRNAEASAVEAFVQRERDRRC